MRVATLNLLHGLSPADGQVDAARLAEAVRALDADVLCLQEVDRDQPRSGRLDLTAICAEALGAQWSRFEPALAGTPGQRAPVAGASRRRSAPPAGDEPVIGAAYGVAIVSRLPVRSWQRRWLPPPRLPMPMPGVVPVSRGGRVRLAAPRLIRDDARVLLAAELDGVSVGCAHLTFVPGPNARQLRAATSLLASMPGPRLLLGDLNMPPPLPALVSGWRPLARGRTFPAWRPRLQIDHVLADSAVVVRGVEIRRLAVSDHCAVLVDLEP